MRHAVYALAALLALPSAAIACSCAVTDDPVQLREFAEDAARGAVALVEVEAVRGYQAGQGGGEDVQVIRTLAGVSAKSFRVARGEFASSASCDDLLEVGKRKVVILYPDAGSTSGQPTYRVSSLCTNLLLDKPVFRDTITGRIGVGERG